MTDRTALTGPDLTSLAASGRVPTPAAQAAYARRWGSWAVVRYYLVTSKAWAATMLVEAVGQPLVYLVAMGLGLGRLVERGSGGVDGVPYLVFVAPALLVSTVVMGASGEFTYPVMAGFKWRRIYLGPAATPLTPAQVATGQLLGPGLRFLVQGALFLVLMVAFGAVRSGWAWLVVPVAALAALAFGGLLMAYAATLEDESYQFAMVQRFVVMPLFLFSGTFFPLAAMPVWLQWVGWLSPVWHGTQLARHAAYGMVEPLWLTATHLGFLVLCLAAGLLLSRRVFTRRLLR